MQEGTGQHRDVLGDKSACVRILWALKAGRAPREGVRVLSVGLDDAIRRLEQVFSDASRNSARCLLLLADYGEGKSHLLRLSAELAKQQGFAWGYLVQGEEGRVGLHKPGWLLRQLLLQLRWNEPRAAPGLESFATELEHLVRQRLPANAPEKSRWSFSWFIENNVHHRTDRALRDALSLCLSSLARHVAACGYRGLVVCVDELESWAILHGRQKPIFQHVLNTLLKLPSAPLVCLLAFTTAAAREVPENEVLMKIVPPALTRTTARGLAERLYRLHSQALGWDPTIDVDEVELRAWAYACQLAQGRWRAFVRKAIHELEVAHQQDIGVTSIGSVQTEIVEKRPLSGPRPQQRALLSQPRRSPVIGLGDRVEILTGPLRGWRGTVVSTSGEEAELILAGRAGVRVRAHIRSLKRLTEAAR